MTTPNDADDFDLSDAEAEQLLADAVAEDDLEPGEESAPGSDDDPRLSRARKDAAAYRERLRAVEAEREALREELNEHRRDRITRLAADAGMAAPEDLFAVVDPAALHDPTGRVDEDRVRGAVADTLAARPHWRRPAPLPGRPVERLRGGADPDNPPREPSWADVLQQG